ncbi:MAG: hypothetical protein K940chlam5_00380 [Candidatus Anoxychlamydiales bacterium]|nr:hypothetical protein [Candidatus Anoxychlamydiales bacterium]
MSSSLFPFIFGREKPLKLFPVDSDDTSSKECDKSSESDITAVDSFEIDILNEHNGELLTAEKKLENAQSSLKRLSEEKAVIDEKIIKTKRNITSLESKSKTCGLGKKGRAKRNTFQSQLQAQGDLLSGFEKQSGLLIQKLENVQKQIPTFHDEKISIEKMMI